MEWQKRLTSSTEELEDSQVNKILDSIMPDGSSLAWPFMYLWLSIFQFQDNSFLNTKDSKNLSSILIDIWINWIVVIVYTFVLLALFITNLLRVLVLWITIPLSPFIILFSTLDEFKNAKSGLWKLSEILDMGNILKLLFKPVIFTVYLSLIFIIATTMMWILTSNKEKIEIQNGGVVLENTSDSSTISSDGIFSFSMEWTKKGVSHIIVYIFILFLLVTLAKLSITSKTGISFVDNTMNDISKLWKSVINNVGVIPVPTKDGVKSIWIWAARNLVNVKTNQYIQWLDDENVERMKERFWLKEKDLWRLAMSGWKDRRDASQEKLLKQGDQWSLVSGERAWYLPTWINKNYKKFEWREKKLNEDLSIYFRDPKNELLLQNIIYELTKNWKMDLYEWNRRIGNSFPNVKDIKVDLKNISKYKIK